MKAAGILLGKDSHHLDHLAPLCSLWEVPLFVTEERIGDLARIYYPDLEWSLVPAVELPSLLVQDYDTVISCLPRVLIEEFCFVPETLLGKKLHTLWCPHGNSDKGWDSPFMEALQDEETLLIYGNRMRHFLQAKQVHKPMLCVGNYRLAYYERHKQFYDQLLDLDPQKKRVLYAPTWEDQEGSSSFREGCHYVMQGVPSHAELLIKPHPHLYQQCPQQIEQVKEHIVADFPPVYPLLASCALYIGDRSSIGYDFLFFERPMIFLRPSGFKGSHPEGLALTECGPVLDCAAYGQIGKIIASLLQQNPWQKKQRELYRETFDPCTLSSNVMHCH
jgi:hypothetical protein